MFGECTDPTVTGVGRPGAGIDVGRADVIRHPGELSTLRVHDPFVTLRGIRGGAAEGHLSIEPIQGRIDDGGNGGIFDRSKVNIQPPKRRVLDVFVLRQVEYLFDGSLVGVTGIVDLDGINAIVEWQPTITRDQDEQIRSATVGRYEWRGVL